MNKFIIDDDKMIALIDRACENVFFDELTEEESKAILQKAFELTELIKSFEAVTDERKLAHDEEYRELCRELDEE
jgi:hypothetical protein